jgi:ribosomal protein S18 acetylase RimI-like enzyme
VIGIKQLDNSNIGKIAEIDRSEHVTLNYVYKDGKLCTKHVDMHVPRWPADGSWGFEARIRSAARTLEEGGTILGAFDGDLLVGYAALRPRLTESMAQLEMLFVSRGYRRRGIAKSLTAGIIQLAKEGSAVNLYVSATPSESAVGFYESQGFRLAEKVNPELYALEPEDIHMIKAL